jgi:undecaprenyl diphosphate synthase
MPKAKSSIPQHIALIMDGNRRWARGQGLALFDGHSKGEDRIEPIIDTAMEMGIGYLTFWAFSTENWNRDQKEVQFLLKLYRENLHKKVDSFHKKNVKINVIGNIAAFPEDIQKKTQEWMERTKNNTKIIVNIALSYGGRDEIVRAMEKMKLEAGSGKFEMTQNEFGKHLDTAGQPDPDLLIRTGGEQRLSGFLLWQMEYTELYFTPTLWPEFTPERFKEAIEEYGQRQRRFGK